MAIRLCAKCGKFIKDDGITLDGKLYHRECLACTYCGGPLTGTAISYKGGFCHPECNPSNGKKVCAYCRKHINGSYYTHGEKCYHKDCYHKYIEKTCIICGKPINGYYIVDPWGNYAHLDHKGIPTKLCCSCGHIIAGSSTSIGVDAELCSSCSLTSVTSRSQVEKCRETVLSLFKSLGVTGIPEHIPIVLERCDDMPGRRGHIRYSGNARHSTDFHIGINFGLPEIHFQGVLAHEMLHSWLALYGREVTDDECEGFCNLGSAFVYQKSDTEHARHLLERMYESKDKIYGEGYRLMKARYERLGWAGLLETLKG